MEEGLNLFFELHPEWGLLFQDEENTFILLLSSSLDKKNPKQDEVIWMVHMEIFSNDGKFAHDIYTSSAVLYNDFGDVDQKVGLINAKEEKEFIFSLYELCLSRSLRFSSDTSKKLFRIHMSNWQKKYKFDICMPFFPNNS